MFDIDKILHTEIEEIGDTVYKPIPEALYNAYISKIEARSVVTSDGPSPIVDIFYTINHPEEEGIDLSDHGDAPTVKQGHFLEVDENGGIARGANKNVKFWNVFKAVGKGQDGKPVGPISGLEGEGPVRILVGHRYDKNDPEIVYAEVKRVTAAG